MMPEGKCTVCGTNFADTVDWRKVYARKPRITANSVSWRFKCPKCRREYELVYCYKGIWSPRARAHVVMNLTEECPQKA